MKKTTTENKIVMIMAPSKGETEPKPYKFKRINFIVSYFIFASDRFISHPEAFVNGICLNLLKMEP